jgi:hypothetical protein
MASTRVRQRLGAFTVCHRHSERTVNFYVEKIGTQGVQHKTALYPTPGQQAWITAASSGGVLVDVGGRGGIWTGARAFVVIGPGYYEVFADATIIRRGTVAIDGNPAQLAYNGTTGGQIAICSGGNLYVHTLSTNVVALELTGEAHQVAMLDEYFLALNQTTGKLRLSNLNDGLTWDPTQFALPKRTARSVGGPRRQCAGHLVDWRQVCGRVDRCGHLAVSARGACRSEHPLRPHCAVLVEGGQRPDSLPLRE